jgi:hypothetical protein
MAMETLCEQDFHQAAASTGMLVVALASDIAFASLLDKVRERHRDARFGGLSGEDAATLAEMFGLGALPALLIMRDQVVLYCEPGAVSEEVLETLLARVGALDMGVVRGEIEAAKAAEISLGMRRVCPTARRTRG